MTKATTGICQANRHLINQDPWKTKKANNREETESIDLQRIVAILLQVSESPRTANELGLTRREILKLVKTGYFEWKRVVFLTEKGREMVKWLLKGGKEDEVEFFEAVKQETFRRMANRGNRITAGIRMLRPIHIHIMRKIMNGQVVFYADIERKALKELVKWELVKRIGSHDTLVLTRLGREFLICFDEASNSVRPIINQKEVMREG